MCCEFFVQLSTAYWVQLPTCLSSSCDFYWAQLIAVFWSSLVPERKVPVLRLMPPLGPAVLCS